MRQKKWPKDYRPARIEDIIDPLIDIIKKHKEGKEIAYKGLPLTLDKILATSFSIGEKLTPESLKYEEEEGRSFMKVVLLIAFQLGLEQAERIREHSIKYKLEEMLKKFNKDE